MTKTSTFEHSLTHLFSKRQIRGIFFDMDGTLVDTEPQTAESIRDVMLPYGISNAALSSTLTSGCSWANICLSLAEVYPVAATIPDLETQLIERWDFLVKEQKAQAVTGAVEALREATKHFPVAVVSSSPLYLVNQLLDKIGVSDVIPPEYRLGGDSIERPKPDPMPFLIAAQRMGIAPHQGLVFEDSSAGIQAAHGAEMACIALTEAASLPHICHELADVTLTNYLDLPTQFWSKLAEDQYFQL